MLSNQKIKYIESSVKIDYVRNNFQGNHSSPSLLIIGRRLVGPAAAAGSMRRADLGPARRGKAPMEGGGPVGSSINPTASEVAAS
jgi:hypothetical protein